jgi:hypothetical protein
LALFRAEGFADFTATPQALFNSLAPLVALPIVRTVSIVSPSDAHGRAPVQSA